jgi:hypothetical protein
LTTARQPVALTLYWLRTTSIASEAEPDLTSTSLALATPAMPCEYRPLVSTSLSPTVLSFDAPSFSEEIGYFVPCPASWISNATM